MKGEVTQAKSSWPSGLAGHKGIEGLHARFSDMPNLGRAGYLPLGIVPLQLGHLHLVAGAYPLCSSVDRILLLNRGYDP